MALTKDEQTVVDHWQAYGEGSDPDEHVAKGRLHSFRGQLYHIADEGLVALSDSVKRLHSELDTVAPAELLAEVRAYLHLAPSPQPAPAPRATPTSATDKASTPPPQQSK